MELLLGVFILGFIAYVIVTLLKKEEPPTATQRELARKMYGEPEKSNEELLADAALMMQKIEAATQADEAGHEDVKAQIMAGTYEGELPERRADGGWTSIFDDLRILSVAGINHRQGINRYKGRNMVALVPEPTNEFDPQAIKVVAEDGHHLGYVQRHQTEMVRSWASDEFPLYCVCRIEEHEDDDDGHQFFVGYLYIKRL